MNNPNNMPEISYNDAIQEIECIIKEMQSDTCDIDKLANNTKRAAELIGICKQKLTRTESEIQNILNTLEKAE